MREEYDRRVNTVLRVAEWVEKWGFRIAGALVRVVTALLARILGRGRFRPWRSRT
jgi:hypothetical protein